MFDDTDAETYGVDVEKRARAYRQQYPDAPPQAVEMAVRLDVLDARVEAERKRRRKEAAEVAAREELEAAREELEAKVKHLEERLDALLKATAGTQQAAGPEATDDDSLPDEERAAIEKESEVFTR